MASTTDTLRHTLELIVTRLVDEPDDIRIEATESQKLVVFEIHSPPDDMGKIVGKSGRNIQAIRTLMAAIGAKHDHRVQVEIIEPDVPL